MQNIKRAELLAPAGDLEKLKIAIKYGADAVYMGGKSLGLRAKAKNLDMSEIIEAVEFVHNHNAKVYITANIFAHNDDFEGIEAYFRELQTIGVDALIISDPGIFSIAKNVIPDMDIHVSTQANNTNFYSADFWRRQGARRVVLARELSFGEISEIHKKMSAVDSDFELEAFVHGAMCISYSGRCLLSNYMTGRDSNHGECSHPCRWKYALVEEKRPGEFMPVYEDERGTYIFNSKDMCMIASIPQIIEAGIVSLKIEGRMKTSYYVAATTMAYRKALNDYYTDIKTYEKSIPEYIAELEKASHRDFTTGFYYNKPGTEDQIYTNNSYIRDYDFTGVVLGYDEKVGLAQIEQRNKFVVGEEVEFFTHSGKNFMQTIDKIYNESMEEIKEAPHPKQKVFIKTNEAVSEFDIMRKQMDKGRENNE